MIITKLPLSLAPWQQIYS